MFNISFSFDDTVIKPDEYTMGYMNIEHGDDVLSSKDLSGRGLMMVFFSLTSLLESVFKLNEGKSGKFRFVGEDSSFILSFERMGKKVRIIQDKKVFCEIPFDDFVRVVWGLSESLFSEYGERFDNGNIAKKDWLHIRDKVSPVVASTMSP